jgi:hypothetical protein
VINYGNPIPRPLGQLAARHTRGEITDAEVESEKRSLLGN